MAACCPFGVIVYDSDGSPIFVVHFVDRGARQPQAGLARCSLERKRDRERCVSMLRVGVDVARKAPVMSLAAFAGTLTSLFNWPNQLPFMVYRCIPR